MKRNTFNRLSTAITLAAGLLLSAAAALVAGFQRRCPLYGSIAVASARVVVEHATVPAAN